MKEQLSNRFILGFIFLATSISLAKSSANLQDYYYAQRSQILAEEFRHSLGGALGFVNGEESANDILMAAKNEEVLRGFENVSVFLPAQNFMTVADKIKESPTFKIIEKLPKGAVLHCHDISLTSQKWLYENITFRQNLYICRPDDDGSISYRFSSGKINDIQCDSSMGWELLADLRADKTIADKINTLVWNSLSIVVPDPATTYPNIDIVWIAAEKVFATVGSLLAYRPVWIDYYYQGLKELREDKVLYLELRSSLPTLYDLDGKTYGPVEVVGIYKNATERFVRNYPDFIGAKIIYSTLRNIPKSELADDLKILISIKKAYPDFVAGFDLVGQEDKGYPLVTFADQIRSIPSDIQLFFHAGESNWNGLSTDENLIDAILLNTTRLGHGFALIKHQAILKRIKQQEIPIEINPIANQIGHVNDLRNHPSSFLFSENYPIVISCDDPGLWGAVGLSYDFYEAFVGIMSRHADLRALKQLAINSIKYSTMSRNQKSRAYELWTKQWVTFVKNLV